MVCVITPCTNGAAMLATPTPIDTHTMCLLHGDFHVMGQDCWAVTLDYYLEHQDIPETQARHRYLEAVERKMLDNLLPKRRPSAGSR